MTVEMAGWIVAAGGVYLALGLAFATAFVAAGAPRIDPAARGMPWTARLLLVPGATVLWPLMLFKWVARQSPPVS